MSKTKDKKKEMAKKMKSNMGVYEKDTAPENESVKYNPKGEVENESRGKGKKMPEKDEKESNKR